MKEYTNRIKSNGIKQELSSLPLSVKFETTEEAQNFYDSYSTKFYRYVCNITVMLPTIQSQVVPFMKTYTHPWTDETLYKYFDLTDEEILEIESSYND